MLTLSKQKNKTKQLKKSILIIALKFYKSTKKQYTQKLNKQKTSLWHANLELDPLTAEIL